MTDSSTGVNPGYDNNTAADETMLKEISNKNKPKKVSKIKDQATQLRQMDEQLVQCKARIVILEDTNRDYKNTINMLRSQLEARCNLTEGNRYISNTSHHPEPRNNILRLENIMTTLKNEIELRDMKMQHQLEMNEMKIRVNMLEMQKELVDKM